MKTIDLKDCDFPVEQRCLFNPTHNTSIAAAAGIFTSGKVNAGGSNFGFVSLRYGVGAMYFNGVTLEFSIERLLAMAPMDIEVIDKTGSLASCGYSGLAGQAGQIAWEESSQVTWRRGGYVRVVIARAKHKPAVTVGMAVADQPVSTLAPGLPSPPSRCVVRRRCV